MLWDCWDWSKSCEPDSKMMSWDSLCFYTATVMFAKASFPANMLAFTCCCASNTSSTWMDVLFLSKVWDLIMSINCHNLRLCHKYTVQAAQTNPLIHFIINFSLEVVQHHESADGATRDTCRPVRPAVQERMWLLWQRSMAGAVLQVLEGRIPAGTTKTDPGRLGFGRKVRHCAASWPKISLQIALVVYCSAVFYLDWKFSSVK